MAATDSWEDGDEHSAPASVMHPPAPDSAPRKSPAAMSHREIMEALSGLLLGMFVAILSSTVVANALPRIITELGGTQGSYTWVVTATLVTMTASTPLWGKLADMFSKKLLVQTALVIFVLASSGAGLSQDTSTLIAFRAVQGLGVGGLIALSQTVMAAMISPRERGRYMGYLGAVFAVATVGGPLLGGVITDTSWLGWRWCFYVGVPFAVAALVVLQKTLKLPVAKRPGIRVDWPGALLITAAVVVLLLWITLAGDAFPWWSWRSAAMVGGSLLLGTTFVLAEKRSAEPIIPLRLFRNRTIALSALASLFVGLAMFGATVFLSQYFQLARGQSPTMSGVMTIPMITGMFLATAASGRIITRTGSWKGWLVTGAALMTAGLGLLGTMRYDTPYWELALFMALLGLGVGMMMQNLVLAGQNQVGLADLGAAGSLITFFRSLGGAVGVSVMGALLADRIAEHVREGLARLGMTERQNGSGSLPVAGDIPDVRALPEPLRTVVESAFGHGIADLYLLAAPVALLVFGLVLAIKEVPLRTAVVASEQAQPPAEPGN